MAELLQISSTLLFFFVYYRYGIYTASLCLSVLSLVQFLASYFIKLPKTAMSQSSLLLLSLFGFATWYFNNPLFIQWKITIVNIMFAFVLYLYRYFNDTAFFTDTFKSSNLSIPNHVGLVADNALIGFFTVVAALNYWVFTHFSESAWVNFKTGLIFFNILYILLITAYISRHIKPMVTDE